MFYPVDTSLNTEGVKLSLYQFDFAKSVSLIKGRLEELGEEIQQARIALTQESETLKAGALGTIVLNTIDEWVQRGKATTTVRSDNDHNNFYRGDGLYVSRGRGSLVNIEYLGKIQLIDDKIVGEGIEMELDEFAEKEGWSSWEAFTKGLPGEPASKWSGQKLARGVEVNYYSITPYSSETTGFEEFDSLPSVSDKPTMFYAGVGSRETPQEWQQFMQDLAKVLERLGFTLRSGAARGADLAFERGTAKKQIFPAGVDPGVTEIKIAQAIHPNWQGMLDATRRSALAAGRDPESAVRYVISAMARNTNQIFGADLNVPVDFVVCWTPDGAETTKERGKNTGGTGQAIDMADRKDIPVFNLAKEGAYERLMEHVSLIVEDNKQGTTVRNYIEDILNSNNTNVVPTEVAQEQTTQPAASSAIQKFLDEQFDNYLPRIQQMRGYKSIETKEDFLNLEQKKQDSIIKKLCKS